MDLDEARKIARKAAAEHRKPMVILTISGKHVPAHYIKGDEERADFIEKIEPQEEVKA